VSKKKRFKDKARRGGLERLHQGVLSRRATVCGGAPRGGGADCRGPERRGRLVLVTSGAGSIQWVPFSQLCHGAPDPLHTVFGWSEPACEQRRGRRPHPPHTEPKSTQWMQCTHHSRVESHEINLNVRVFHVDGLFACRDDLDVVLRGGVEGRGQDSAQRGLQELTEDLNRPEGALTSLT
jgi:hypothetical protein